MNNKSQIKIKINSWSEVTLGQYEKITDILTDDAMSDTEKDIALLSILYDIPESDIWNMEITTVQAMRMEASWLNNAEPKISDIKVSSINVGKYECTIDTNIQHMSMSQYVDFQTYFDKEITKKAEIMSVFLIPNGCKYGEGYDMADFINEIRNNIDISTYNSVWFFFLQKYQSSTLKLADSLEAETWMRQKMMKKKNPKKALMKELTKKLKDLKTLPIFGSHS